MKPTNKDSKVKSGVQKTNEVEPSPLIKSMKGAFTAPDNFDYKKELAKRNK